MKKPVKVFILMGQSNMVGMGDIRGGGGQWGETILKPVMSVYEGAYAPTADYDQMKPVSTTELKTIGEMKPPTTPAEFTAVIRMLDFPKVKTRQVRLHIFKAEGAINLNEFQVLSPQSK